MSKKKPDSFLDYAGLLSRIKDRIWQSQGRAVLAVNAELRMPSRLAPPGRRAGCGFL